MSADLAGLIRERHAAILKRWEELVRNAAIARSLAPPALFDSMPEFLDRIAHTVERGEVGDSPECQEAALEHAQQRLELGYELGQLIAEYGALRIAILDELHAAADHIPLRAWRPLIHTIELAVGDVMHRFSRSRDRKLRALERISTEVLGAPSFDTLLEHVVSMLIDVVPEVDEVTILLRDGERLRARATRGLESEIATGFSLAIGEGFSGTIAATREPLLIRDPGGDPLVRSPALRGLGLKVLYGVPLLDAQDLVGVAHMGSKTAYDFQQEDLLLFRALSNRATVVIASRRTAERQQEMATLREHFMGVLAHDLRSPINSIVGSAELLLRRGQLPEADRRAVARIAQSAERMGRLVSDVLDFARARLGGGIPVSQAWIDLGELARAACEEAEAANPGHRIELRATLRSRVWCDPDRVSQLLSNLLTNAVKHGARGTPVTVVVDEADEAVVLSVHNQGPPIPPELLPHVFEAFRQDPSARTRGRGLGLGLYVAKAIALAHGGAIEARSDLETGTTFVVTLPPRPPPTSAPD
ncbi:MAG: GAF domain-containing protein [Myxococcales bacterium]|nr:GAF domain-containing protein [Myxococcales bacterium]